MYVTAASFSGQGEEPDSDTDLASDAAGSGERDGG
jgi:hypothetical protein